MIMGGGVISATFIVNNRLAQNIFRLIFVIMIFIAKDSLLLSLSFIYLCVHVSLRQSKHHYIYAYMLIQ